MPTLPTAEEVFGSRQIARSSRPVQGYDTSAISQANIRSAESLENIGGAMFKTGVNMLEDQRVAAEKSAAEQEKVNLKYDAALEARAKSDYLLKSLELKKAVKFDPNFDSKKGLEEFGKIKQQYAGAFKTLEGAQGFDLYDKEITANLAFDFDDIIMTRNQNAFIADVDDRYEKTLVAMSQATDPNEIAELAKVSRQLVQSKTAIAGYDPEILKKQDRAISKQIGYSYYNTLPDTEKQKLLFGEKKDYGLRPDGSPKGSGFLGELKNKNGDASTEISVGVNIDGKEMEIPTLVPTLTEKEKDYLLSGKEPTKEIVDKAVAHARKRLEDGKSPFAQDGEQVSQSASSYAQKVRNIESAGSGDLTAKNPNSSAKGRYQWIDSTARQYGLLGDGFDYRGDAEKEEAAFKQFTEDNRIALYNDLGREPTDAELYLAHQQGADGAASLLSDPDAKAVDALTPVYDGDRVLATKAVVNNGGNVNMTAKEFADKWINKYGEGGGNISVQNQPWKGTPLAALDIDEIDALKKQFTSEKEKKLTDFEANYKYISSIMEDTLEPVGEAEVAELKRLAYESGDEEAINKANYFEALQPSITKMKGANPIELQNIKLSLSKEVESSPTKETRELLKIVEGVEAKQKEAITKEGLAYFGRIGEIRMPNEIQWGDLEKTKYELGQRAITSAKVRAKAGQQLSPLLPAEVDQLAKMSKEMPPEEFATFLDSFSALDPQNKRMVAEDLSDKNPVLYAVISTDDMFVRKQILRGSSSGVPQLYEKKEMDSMLSAIMSELYIDPAAREDISSAVEAFYKISEFDKGSQATTVDERKVKEAMQKVVGPLVDVGGQEIFSFKNPETNQFLLEDEIYNVFNSVTADSLKDAVGEMVFDARGKELEDDDISNMRFVSAGAGSYYMLLPTGEYVPDPKDVNKRLVVDGYSLYRNWKQGGQPVAQNYSSISDNPWRM